MNQLCLKPGRLAQQEERLGGEGSDAQSAGGLVQVLGWEGPASPILDSVAGALCDRVTELG